MRLHITSKINNFDVTLNNTANNIPAAQPWRN